MAQLLVPGTKVGYAGKCWRVDQPLGPDAVLLRNETGETISVDPVRVGPATEDVAIRANHIASGFHHAEAAWIEAERRRDILLSLFRMPERTRQDIDAAATELGIKRRRVWELLREGKHNGFEVAEFLPRQSGPRLKRLSPEVEAIIRQTIEQHFAAPTRPSLASLHGKIGTRCQAASLPSPSYRAVQARVAQCDQIWLKRRREGSQAAQSLRLLTGAHPGGERPWARVQIDSTPCDILLVDETDRMVIGCATATFAIDLYSRAVAGFSCSLEAASTLTVAACLEHACLPKDSWLARRELGRLSWPIYGKPEILEYDRGPENEAHGIQRGLKLHGIKPKVRKTGHPEQHGHIERLIGTMMCVVHELPGTTFSNINDRGNAEPHKSACLTLPELERVLALAIDSYNHSTHGSTGERPIERYLAYYRRPELPPAERIPPLLRPQLLLDFLPYELRALRRTGIRLFRVDYSSLDLLPLWRRDNQQPVERVVVYDPRSLRQVWIADEVSGEYIAVPYRIPHPDMTLAESVEARSAFHEAKARDRTERRLFENLSETRAIVAQAKSKTTRRKAERTFQAAKNVQDRSLPAMPESNPNKVVPTNRVPAWHDTDVTPFSDVERV